MLSIWVVALLSFELLFCLFVNLLLSHSVYNRSFGFNGK